MHSVLGVGLFAASGLEPEPGFGFELGVVLWVLMCAVLLAVHVGGSVSEHGDRIVAGVFVGLVLMVTVVAGAAFLAHRHYSNEVADYESLPRVASAARADTATAALAALAQDSHSDVREAVATNRGAASGVLDVLGSDRDENVRAAVAFNPSTSTATLDRLSLDSSRLVRSCVGQNPSTPPAVLMRLAADSDAGVRLAAVRNPNTPVDVADVVAQNADTAPHPASRTVSDITAARVVVASDPNVAAAVLEALAADTDPVVRAAVAANPALSSPILETLMRDPDPVVAAEARSRFDRTYRDQPQPSDDFRTPIDGDKIETEGR